MQGEELVQGVLNAIEPVVKGIQIAAQNARCAVLHFCISLEVYVELAFPAHNEQVTACRYGFLVYNGSVHYWRISQALQREGRRCHLLASTQTIVDAVRKLSDKQGWLSCLLLQLALAQLEVGHPNFNALPHIPTIFAVRVHGRLNASPGAQAVH